MEGSATCLRTFSESYRALVSPFYSRAFASRRSSSKAITAPSSIVSRQLTSASESWSEAVAVIGLLLQPVDVPVRRDERSPDLSKFRMHSVHLGSELGDDSIGIFPARDQLL